MYTLERNDDEINDVLNRVAEAEDGGSKWPGMSYESGVRAAIDWLTGQVDENPMDE